MIYCSFLYILLSAQSCLYLQYKKLLGFLINNNQLQKTVLANQKEADYIIFRKEHSSNPQNKKVIVICIVYQHITYPYIKNSSTNSNLVDYAI